MWKNWVHIPNELNQPELWGHHLAFIKGHFLTSCHRTHTLPIYITCLCAPGCGHLIEGNWIKEVTMTLSILMRLLFSLFTSLTFGYTFSGQIRKYLYVHFQKFHNPLSIHSVIKIWQLTHKTEQSVLMIIKFSNDNKNTLGTKFSN